jgi:hypothetical protein
MTRNAIEQVVVDLLGRVLAGLTEEADTPLRTSFAKALLESELGCGQLPYRWAVTDMTGATHPEADRLLTRLTRGGVPPTKWTDLFMSSSRLATRLSEAASGGSSAEPWRAHYVMERDLELRNSLFA